jgi:AraC-like DNA-binding protein
MSRSIFGQEEYTGKSLLLSELRLVGRNRLRKALPNRLSSGHSHSGVYEIFYFLQGRVRRWAENEAHEIRANDIYLMRPGENHGHVGVHYPCLYYWVQVALSSKMPDLDSKKSSFFSKSFSSLKLRLFPGSAKIGEYFEQILEQHRNPGIASLIAARATLHLFLLSVLNAHEAALRGENLRRTPSYQIRKTLDWIERNVAENIPVVQLAKIAGLSAGHFRERFFNETGFTPSDYLMRSKTEKAKQLLTNSFSVTQVAFDLGFSSSQYFATVFKKFQGVTPSEFLFDKKK